VHFNGWGDYPNPTAYTNRKRLHAYFEGEFVRRYLTRDVVAAEVKPWEDCRCSIQDKTRILLEMSLGNVTALYDVKKVGGFKGGDPRGVEFATARLALGAQFARDTYNSRNATGETLPGRRDNLRSALPTRRERHSCSRSQATTTSWRTKQRYATRLKSRTWSGIPRAFFWIEPHQRAFGRSPKSEEQARRPWPLPAPAAAPTRV